MFAILAVLAVGSAVVQAKTCRREHDGQAGVEPIAPQRTIAWLPPIAAVVLIGGTLLAAANERPGTSGAEPRGQASAQRLGSVQTHRYAYWKVALRTFAHNPVRGVGSAGFRVEWLRRRPFRAPAVDAHSLYIETAAELGLVGLAALALLLVGVAMSTREAWRRDPALAAGWCAIAAAWALHAGIDWDWEMPALTLIAVIAAGGLIATAEAPPATPPGEPRRRATTEAASAESATTPPARSALTSCSLPLVGRGM
jgi:O-antigen ligase